MFPFVGPIVGPIVGNSEVWGRDADKSLDILVNRAKPTPHNCHNHTLPHTPELSCREHERGAVLNVL